MLDKCLEGTYHVLIANKIVAINTKKEDIMSDKEKTILENLSKSLTKATDSQKEYLLGLADGMALMAEGEKKSKRKPKPNK